MTIPAMEKVLWQIYVNHAETQRFCADAQAYMQDYRLADAERSLLTSFDVMGMISHGVNPLLVMMAFQATQGYAKMPEYFATVNAAAAA